MNEAFVLGEFVVSGGQPHQTSQQFV